MTIGDIIFILAIAGAISFVIYRWRKDMALLRTVTSPYRGVRSERKLVLKLLKQGFSPIALYHDLYVEKYPGHYAQIDTVLVTKVGIIVFEVKDYSGWIFGNGKQRYWTQVLAYVNKKYILYNPFMQNEGHIVALKKRLSCFADVPFYSVVIFYGSCQLRDISNIPYDSYIGYPADVKYIVRNILDRNKTAYYSDKMGVVSVLRDAVAGGKDPMVVNRHIHNVRNSMFRH